MSEPTRYLDTNAAAKHVGVATYTLRRSRNTGILLGKPSPRFIKRGKKQVVYSVETLNKWLDQFEDQAHTVDLGDLDE